MQNIPVFTASHGMASLILREIPFSKRAYILIRAVWNGQTEGLLSECTAFCRMAGAEQVYASDGVNDLPGTHAYDVISMACSKDRLPPPERPVELVPVSPQNGSTYLEIYNTCFRELVGAASYDSRDIRRMITEKKGFLARREGNFAGVVELDADGIAGIGVLPQYRGLGYDLALTALCGLNREVLRLKVADTNERALALYRRIGFEPEKLVSRWWLI